MLCYLQITLQLFLLDVTCKLIWYLMLVANYFVAYCLTSHANYLVVFLLCVTCKSFYKYFLAVVDDDALVVSVNFYAHKVVGV